MHPWCQLFPLNRRNENCARVILRIIWAMFFSVHYVLFVSKPGPKLGLFDHCIHVLPSNTFIFVRGSLILIPFFVGLFEKLGLSLRFTYFHDFVIIWRNLWLSLRSSIGFDLLNFFFLWLWWRLRLGDVCRRLFITLQWTNVAGTLWFFANFESWLLRRLLLAGFWLAAISAFPGRFISFCFLFGSFFSRCFTFSHFYLLWFSVVGPQILNDLFFLLFVLEFCLRNSSLLSNRWFCLWLICSLFFHGFPLSRH